MNDFIIFSFPNSETFFIIENQENQENNNKIELISFDYKKTIIFSNNCIKEININNFKFNNILVNLNEINIFNEIKQKDYKDKVKKCIDLIQKKELEKIVISRKKIIKYNNINLQKTLINFKAKFPNTFIYFFKKNNEYWIGATPELLADLHENQFKTIALAGTLKQEFSFSDKEKEEQKMVQDFITNILKEFSDKIIISPTKEHKFNNIKHLITEFNAEINPNDYLKIINKLHPTSAVCGFPQNKAFDYIQQIENYNREFYTGKININLDNKKISYVNLRCFKIYKNSLEIFIGGGITSKSNPEKEWQETEIKLENIKNSIIF